MSCTKRFIRVDDGSTCEITTTAIARDFLISGEASRNGELFEEWSDPDLVGKTVHVELTFPNRYMLFFPAVFTGTKEGKVRLVFVIRRPDGSIHSEPFVCELAGTRPDGDNCQVNIHMQDPSAGQEEEN